MAGATLVLTLTAGAGSLSNAKSASAAVCTHEPNRNRTEANDNFYVFSGRTFFGDSICGNDHNAPVYGLPSFTAFPQVGIMHTTSSFFVCWVSGDPSGGGNNIWYYTEADVVVPGTGFPSPAWGFMPAVNVHTVNDPGDSRLPQC